MDVLTQPSGLARSRLTPLTKTSLGFNNTQAEGLEYSKPVSTPNIPRPTHQEVGTSTFSDIWKAPNCSKRPRKQTTTSGGVA